MKKIKLSKGKFALVDDEDFEWLNKWKWYFDRYAYRVEYLGKIKGKYEYKTVYIHKLLVNYKETDHINRNKLDNRKCNLREVNRSQNRMNTGISSKNTSGYKGVSYNKEVKKWQSYFTINYRQYSLGYFKDKRKAALKYNEAVQKYFGGYSFKNILGGGENK